MFEFLLQEPVACTVCCSWLSSGDSQLKILQSEPGIPSIRSDSLQQYSQYPCRPVRPVFIADDSKNDDLEDSSKAALEPICPAVPIPFSQALPEHGLVEEDFRVYITLRPNPGAARGVTTVCRRDGFGRPAIAHINIHAPFAKAQFARWLRHDVASWQLLRATLHHEMMHAMALMSESLQQFRAPSRRLWGSVVEDADIRGMEAQFLVTPNAAFEVRQQYRIEPPLDRGDTSDRIGGLEILGYRDPGTGTQQVRAQSMVVTRVKGRSHSVEGRISTHS